MDNKTFGFYSLESITGLIHRIDDRIEFQSFESTDTQWFGSSHEYRIGFEILNNQSIQTPDIGYNRTN